MNTKKDKEMKEEKNSVTISKIFGHLRTVLIHKWWVFHYCRLAGIPWRGLVHDLSKFSPIEFWESVKFYQGGKSSPIPAAKKEQGYSLAWQHHKGHNPHHYEHWTDNYDSGTTCIKMPYVYAVEMLCDYLGAARAYLGSAFSFEKELDWWKIKRETVKMNPYTRFFLDIMFEELVRLGEDALNKVTLDQAYKFNTFERLFLGIGTLGMAEIVVDKWVKCEECGYNHDE